ncbi:SIS domain-containing protein [Candidatus Omnitrophota bacterium]
MRKKIASRIHESVYVKQALLKTQVSAIEELARTMSHTIKRGNKIIIFGNGGSASDSIHIAAELVGRFHKERKALPAVALAANISSLTALGNDYGFDYIFERQIEALGKKGDLALGISTSGKSKNVIRGILKASKMKMKTAVLTGKAKERLSQIADISIKVPSNNTPRIQEAHILIGHIVCEIVEDAL